MRDKYILTAESVTEGHPDKLCDAIAGAVSGSSEMGAGDQGIMYGFACSETPQLLPLPVVLAYRLTLTLTNARKLGTIQGLGPDGKAQVSVEYHKGKPARIAAVVLSCRHDEEKDLEELQKELTRQVVGTSSISLAPLQVAGLTHCAVPPLPTKSERLCGDPFGTHSWSPHRNPAERLRWGEEEGMERAESLPKAGTQQSGISSDEARYIAKNIVAAGLAERCTVGLAYAIGRAEPVAVDIDLHETERYPEAVLEQAVRQVFDLTPGGIIRTFWGPRCNPAKRLQWGEEEGMERAESLPEAGTQQSGISSDENQPIFASFCNYGHFTHQDAPWEQTDRTTALAEACEREAR